jgi:hypothetical protein
MKFTVATLNAGGFMTGSYYKDGVSTDFPTIGRLFGNWVRGYDVVLIQEVYDYFGMQLDMVRAGSGHLYSVWHSSGRFWRGAYNGMAGQGILSNHPIEEAIRHLYWNKPKDATNPPEGYPLSYARIRIGSAPVHFFTAHYQHEFPNMRSASLTMIDLISQLPQNEGVCFGGDFNSGACGEPTRFRDPGVLELASGTGGGDIDHILGRHIRIYRTWDRALIEAGRTLTDHPLIALEGEVRVSTSTPRTTIHAGPVQPPQTHPSASATLEFTADQPGATFECSLDCSRFEACTSPKTYTNLRAGQHWFGVRATDSAGNRQRIPTGWTWIVTPPVTVNVPDVVGLAPMMASRRLTDVGLRAGFVGDVEPGMLVESQEPQPNTAVARGSTVTLYLSDEGPL